MSESKKNKGQFKKGHIVSAETRKKLSESIKKWHKIHEHPKGMLGKYNLHSKEWNEKISKSLKGRKFSDKLKKKLALAHKGKKLSEETKKLMSLQRRGRSNYWLRGRKRQQEVKEKISKKLKGKSHSEEHNKNVSESLKKISEKLSIRHKELWQNPKYRKAMIENTIKANHVKPNKKEQLLNNLIQTYFPNQFIYSGDGKVVFPCGCPDFWNINGLKKAINLNGLYWHLWKLQKEENPSLIKEDIEIEDKEKYKQYGIDLLVIWEDELKNKEQLIEKIRGFINE